MLLWNWFSLLSQKGTTTNGFPEESRRVPYGRPMIVLEMQVSGVNDGKSKMRIINPKEQSRIAGGLELKNLQR